MLSKCGIILIISIHALREEGDIQSWSFASSRSDFYPRPPRGGRLTGWKLHDLGADISIHALREEGDAARSTALSAPAHFYPRPPRGGRLHRMLSSFKIVYFYPRPPRGGRHKAFEGQHPTYEFLSTPSARRATAKTETKSLFSNKLYNILHEFRRALIYNGSKSYPNHAK